MAHSGSLNSPKGFQPWCSRGSSVTWPHWKCSIAWVGSGHGMSEDFCLCSMDVAFMKLVPATSILPWDWGTESRNKRVLEADRRIKEIFVELSGLCRWTNREGRVRKEQEKLRSKKERIKASTLMQAHDKGHNDTCLLCSFLCSNFCGLWCCSSRVTLLPLPCFAKSMCYNSA